MFRCRLASDELNLTLTGWLPCRSNFAVLNASDYYARPTKRRVNKPNVPLAARCCPFPSVQKSPLHGRSRTYDTPGPRLEVPSPSMGSTNPYASPSGYDKPEESGAGYGQGIQPTRFDLGDVLSRAWTIFKANLGICILVVIVGTILEGVVSQVGAQSVQIASLAWPDQMLLTGAAYVLQWIVTTLFSVWLRSGMILFLIKLGRGDQAEFADLFRGGPFVLNVVLSAIVFFLGMALLAVPGAAATLLALVLTNQEHPAFFATFGISVLLTLVPISIYSLMFMQYQYLVIDQRLGPIAALLKSREIMAGNKLMYFVLMLVGSAITLMGCLAFCVGALFAIPYSMLLLTVAYLVMTGQPTADQRLHAEGTSFDAPTVK